MSARRALAYALAASLALGGIAGCGSDADDGSTATTTTTETADTTTTASPETLHILVSNDDGYSAPGIDALVQGLEKLDAVEVTVVAPLEQRSATGGQVTAGKLAVTDVETTSGHPAKAVDGFPADTIRVAVDELGVKPDLVVTGINSVANLGPVLDVSGTIGAARAAVARGIPALATSQGGAAEPDYASAIPLISEWITDHRAALVAGEAEAEVTNLNVPTCTTGDIRGLLTVPADLHGDVAAAIGAQDCTSTTPKASLEGDVAAFTNGFATIDVVPAKPAA